MKFKLVKRSIQKNEADHVLELAAWGMSRKLIATEVYGAGSDGKATHSSMMRVHHILRDYDIRVTDYRNGKNQNGRATISAIRREANILESIRAATKEVVALVRKTG